MISGAARARGAEAGLGDRVDRQQHLRDRDHLVGVHAVVDAAVVRGPRAGDADARAGRAARAARRAVERVRDHARLRALERGADRAHQRARHVVAPDAEAREVLQRRARVGRARKRVRCSGRVGAPRGCARVVKRRHELARDRQVLDGGLEPRARARQGDARRVLAAARGHSVRRALQLVHGRAVADSGAGGHVVVGRSGAAPPAKAAAPSPPAAAVARSSAASASRERDARMQLEVVRRAQHLDNKARELVPDRPLRRGRAAPPAVARFAASTSVASSTSSTVASAPRCAGMGGARSSPSAAASPKKSASSSPS